MSTRRSSPSTTALLFLALAASLGACCRPCASPVCRPAATVAPAQTAPTTEARIAAGWMARARAAEPSVTKLLQGIAETEGGELAGLEHRLKSLAATVSKLKRNRARKPGTRLEDVVVYDALRYTLVVVDEPPGHHDAMIRRTLLTLESSGHTVEKVKNYWPRGDTYAGTNCVLATPEGLSWELQFHTPGSYATKDSTHDDYELMRDLRTSLEERRRLFGDMTEVWDAVPIPEGILVEGSLHHAEVLEVYAAP